MEMLTDFKSCSSSRYSRSNLDLNSAGVTNMYVSGNVTFSGGTTNSYQRNPGNFKIVVVGGGTISTSGTAHIETDLYGPSTTGTFAGSSIIAGRIIVGSLSQSSNKVIYQDTYLTGIGWGSGTGSISSVK